MLFATALLSLALAAGPERNCPAPSQTGTFRITAVSRDSSAATVGLVLLENVNDCLEASLLIQDGGPTFIDKVKLDGDLLTGELRLTRGTAKVSLRLTPKDINGSIVDGTRVWRISGRRTGGAETRIAAGDVVR